MKVPKQYKSSNRFNAGVDVVYDDDSKLQYAPFIYATTGSGDNGGSSEDEEGEDTMVVHIDDSNDTFALDKTWTEINNAIGDGKIVMLVEQIGSTFAIEYVASVYMNGNPVTYIVDTLCVYRDEPSTHRYTSETSDGVLTFDESSPD